MVFIIVIFTFIFFALKIFVSLGNTCYSKGDNFLLCMFIFLKLGIALQHLKVIWFNVIFRFFGDPFCTR